MARQATQSMDHQRCEPKSEQCTMYAGATHTHTQAHVHTHAHTRSRTLHTRSYMRMRYRDCVFLFTRGIYWNKAIRFRLSVHIYGNESYLLVSSFNSVSFVRCGALANHESRRQRCRCRRRSVVQDTLHIKYSVCITTLYRHRHA